MDASSQIWKIARIWPKGYADPEGTKTIWVAPQQTPEQAMRENKMPYGTVSSCQDACSRMPDPNREAIALAFRGDNS